MQYILDKDKNPVEADIETWGKFFQNFENRKVAQDQIGEILVSSIFTGLDMGYIGSTKPVLFETMVFGGDLDLYQERYHTWEEALAGHKRAVERVRKCLK